MGYKSLHCRIIYGCSGSGGHFESVNTGSRGEDEMFVASRGYQGMRICPWGEELNFVGLCRREKIKNRLWAEGRIS